MAVDRITVRDNYAQVINDLKEALKADLDEIKADIKIVKEDVKIIKEK
jgi:molybdenum cofactor biosynthesis enzyme MoaA